MNQTMRGTVQWQNEIAQFRIQPKAVEGQPLEWEHLTGMLVVFNNDLPMCRQTYTFLAWNIYPGGCSVPYSDFFSVAAAALKADTEVRQLPVFRYLPRVRSMHGAFKFLIEMGLPHEPRLSYSKAIIELRKYTE